MWSSTASPPSFIIFAGCGRFLASRFATRSSRDGPRAPPTSAYSGWRSFGKWKLNGIILKTTRTGGNAYPWGRGQGENLCFLCFFCVFLCLFLFFLCCFVFFLCFVVFFVCFLCFFCVFDVFFECASNSFFPNYFVCFSRFFDCAPDSFSQTILCVFIYVRLLDSVFSLQRAYGYSLKIERWICFFFITRICFLCVQIVFLVRFKMRCMICLSCFIAYFSSVYK